MGQVIWSLHSSPTNLPSHICDVHELLVRIQNWGRVLLSIWNLDTQSFVESVEGTTEKRFMPTRYVMLISHLRTSRTERNTRLLFRPRVFRWQYNKAQNRTFSDVPGEGGSCVRPASRQLIFRCRSYQKKARFSNTRRLIFVVQFFKS